MRRNFLRKSLAMLLAATTTISFVMPSGTAGIAVQAAVNIAPVTADWNKSYQTMDGVGAAYAYSDSLMLLQLGQAGHQDTVKHLLDLAYDSKNGTGHDIVRVIIGDNGLTTSGTSAASPGFNPVTGLRADANKPGYDIEGNPIPMKGTAGQYGYKNPTDNRFANGNTDSVWPVEPAHDAGTLVPVKDFIWDYPSWNQPMNGDDGGPTNTVNASGDPVVIKNSPRTKKELFDIDQVWTMKQAMKYGVHQFYACMWEAPYWMSNNTDNTVSKIIRTDTATIDGKTVKIYYQAYADYLVNYIKGMWEQYGIPITQINPFNELDLSTSDTSMVKELIDSYIGPSMDKALEPGGALYGIKNPEGKTIDFVPQLAALDGCNLGGQISRGGAAFSEVDPASGKNKYLDLFTTHLYGTVSIGTDETVLTHSGDFAKAPLDYTTAGTKYPEYLTHGYKLWETEFMNQDTGDGSAGAYTQRYGNQNINDAVRYAYLMTNMFCSNPGFNAYLWWSMWDNNGADGSDLIRLATSNSDQANGHVSTLTGEYRAFKRFYGFGHFSRFMNAGDVRFDVSRQPAANLNIVGFKSADNKDFSITVTNANNNDSIQPLEFTLKDFPVGTTSVTVFRTSGSENQKKLGTIPVKDGKFVIDIPSASIVTVVPSEGTYATYNGLDSERDIFSSLEAEGNDNSVPGDTTGNAGRANEAVTLSDGKYLAYKNVNFADGSANGGVVRRHLLYLNAQTKSASGGSLLAYVLPLGTAVSSTADIMSKGTRVAEILVPGSTDYGKYQSMVDTGDLSAYGHKDLYIISATNSSTDNITVDRFLFGANDSDWSPANNNSTVSIPGNILNNGDFDTATGASASNWSTGRYDNGTFVQAVTGPRLGTSVIQRYSGLSRYLKNSSTSSNAASARLSGRINEAGKFDGLWQDVTGKMAKGERYRFEGYFQTLKDGPLGYEIAADNPGDVEAALVYYDSNGNQLAINSIGGRDIPEPYASREAADPAWFNGNTLVGSILGGAPLGVSNWEAKDVEAADWHESNSNPFIYDEPSGTAKVALALYAKDSNIFYTDQLSITPVPDRQGLRDALKAFKGNNLNIVSVVKDALASSSLTQATVSKLISALSKDFYPDMASSLMGIKVDGTAINNFKSDTFNYSVVYPIGGTPNITVEKFDPNANIAINPVSAPGQATVTVTYGEMKSVYTINLTADTSLSSIKVNGSPLISFKPNVYNYFVRVPDGISDIPVIQADAKDPGTKVEVTPAAAVPGVGKVTVSYEGAQTVYNINFMNDKTGSDEFNKTELDKTFWYWINEVPAEWSLSTTPGSMSILTRKGDIYTNSTNMRNILLQNAPGDWTIETKVTASKRPAVAYQQGGLIAFQDMDNYIKLDWVATSATATNIQVNREVNGVVSSTSVSGSIVSTDTNTVWLRMTKIGNAYNVYYSTDGTTFTQLGTSYTLNLNNVQAGLSASNGGGTDTTDFKINFDYFHTTAQIGELLTNKAGLIDQISKAQVLKQADYTVETWTNLQAALTSAMAVRDNINAKQSEVDTGCDNLKNAIKGLLLENYLKSVTLSTGVTLNPDFNSDKLNYSLNVANSVTKFNVIPVFDDTRSVITVNEKPAASGKQSQDINLTVGENRVSIIVTPVDGTPRTYTVTVNRLPYDFMGYLTPIKQDGSFKAGSVIPVKFQLKDIDGVSYPSANAKVYIAEVKDGNVCDEKVASSSGKVDSGNLCRYDQTEKQYVFNWDTSGVKTGTYRIRVDLGDGFTYSVNINLK